MKEFEFTAENLEHFEEIRKRYPVKRAALLPTLHLAQEQLGYVSEAAETYVAELLDLPVVDVREVLSFYTLFHRRLPGRRHIRVCMSLSCWLRGAKEIESRLASQLGVASGETSPDGAISWETVPDCMGACEIAPMLQMNKDYHGDLTPEAVDQLLEKTRE